jgi:ribosomal-protein-alanine N-acetyltransferase
MLGPTMDAVTIRPIEAADADSLGELFVELAAAGEAAHFHPHPLTRDEAARIAGGAPTRRDCYFAAFVGHRLAGYGMLRGWDAGYAIPSFGVAVARQFRSRGLGRDLLRWAIAEARRRGAKTLMLKVYRDNPRARQLYESEGFVFEDMPDDPRQLKGLRPL